MNINKRQVLIFFLFPFSIFFIISFPLNHFFCFLISFLFGLIVFVVGFCFVLLFLFGRVINIYLLLNPIFGFLITIRDFYSKSYLFGFVW